MFIDLDELYGEETITFEENEIFNYLVELGYIEDTNSDYLKNYVYGEHIASHIKGNANQKKKSLFSEDNSKYMNVFKNDLRVAA